MIFKFALFLSAISSVAATGQGNGVNGVGGSGGGNNGNGNQGNIPQGTIRSFDGSEDPRAGNLAFLKRFATACYPDPNDLTQCGGSGNDGGFLGMFIDPDLGYGDAYPAARFISNRVADPQTLATAPGKSIASDMLWQFGQFMDHDVGLTEGTRETGTLDSPDCLTNADIICHIEFTRAISADVNGQREQENEITAFIDGSMVYGHTQTRADALREFSGGRMKVVASTANDLLPPNTAGLANAIPSGFDTGDLFLGGDIRVNEQIGLIAIHTLFVREHNRIAGLLAATFLSATDQELYDLARKLVIAEIQKITYTEFLPVLIGNDAGFSTYAGYDSTVDPSMATEFSTGSFRVGHTFLSETLLTNDGTSDTGSVSLLVAFFDPTLVHDNPNLIDEILIGQTIQAANAADTKVIPEVRDFLFGMPDLEGNGLDLVSLNIQRGRDNGIPKYNVVRDAYGLTIKGSWADVTADTEIQAELASAYSGGVDDCDVWICGLAEDTFSGELGELFVTVIGDQFNRLMLGDANFYLADPVITQGNVRNIVDVSALTLADIINLNTGTTGVTHPAMLA